MLIIFQKWEGVWGQRPQVVSEGAYAPVRWDKRRGEEKRKKKIEDWSDREKIGLKIYHNPIFFNEVFRFLYNASEINVKYI